jgi:putative alpha-1,2-mannosidase
VLTKPFTTAPSGLPGNDDTGVTSAWYVWTAMGLYPALPGQPEYALGSPVFDRVILQLDPAFHTGREFVIAAANNAPNHPFIERAKLNGTLLRRPVVDHQSIVSGGKLELQMSASHP